MEEIVYIKVSELKKEKYVNNSGYGSGSSYGSGYGDGDGDGSGSGD